MSKRKKYKVVKTEHFKQQTANLPENVKKELDRVIEKIRVNPTHLPHSMGIFNEPSPEELRQWMGRTKPTTIDLVFEYLHEKDCLNDDGKKLARAFWEKYIREKK